MSQLWCLVFFVGSLALVAGQTLDCNFDFGTLCEWQNDVTVTNLNWQTASTAVVDAWHSVPRTVSGEGQFAYAQGGGTNSGSNRAVLISPVISGLNRPAFLTFNYWKTAVPPVLQICTETIGQVELTCFDTIAGSGPQSWSRRVVAMPPNPDSFTTMLVATNLNSAFDLIAVDDLQFRLVPQDGAGGTATANQRDPLKHTIITGVPHSPPGIWSPQHVISRANNNKTDGLLAAPAFPGTVSRPGAPATAPRPPSPAPRPTSFEETDFIDGQPPAFEPRPPAARPPHDRVFSLPAGQKHVNQKVKVQHRVTPPIVKLRGRFPRPNILVDFPTPPPFDEHYTAHTFQFSKTRGETLPIHTERGETYESPPIWNDSEVEFAFVNGKRPFRGGEARHIDDTRHKRRRFRNRGGDDSRSDERRIVIEPMNEREPTFRSIEPIRLTPSTLHDYYQGLENSPTAADEILTKFQEDFEKKMDELRVLLRSLRSNAVRL